MSLQPSPLSLLPSSQSSPVSILLFPQSMGLPTIFETLSRFTRTSTLLPPSIPSPGSSLIDAQPATADRIGRPAAIASVLPTYELRLGRSPQHSMTTWQALSHFTHFFPLPTSIACPLLSPRSHCSPNAESTCLSPQKCGSWQVTLQP